jgi:release factor glutamine methyltransferase
VVDKNVLIPRPDTEIILFDIKARFKNSKRLSVLDIGTGSGCILLSILKEFKNYRGVGLDKSKKAINIAKFNSDLLSINNRSKFIKCDVDNYKFDQYYDLIVSNPPYICSHKIKNLSVGIRKFEPYIALDGGKTGLVTVNKVINKAKKILKIGGYLYLEIGYDQSRMVCQILQKNNFKVVDKLMDYNKKVRCIIGTRLK